MSFLLLLMVIIWWHRRRMRRLRYRMEQNGEANMQEISQLKEQITQQRERISTKLLMGAKLFNRIKEKQSLADASANDLQSLVDYFAQLRPKRWQDWERQYADLSTAQYIFLILQDDLHYDDETIAKILDVKRSSVRSMRSRIKDKSS